MPAEWLAELAGPAGAAAWPFLTGQRAVLRLHLGVVLDALRAAARRDRPRNAVRQGRVAKLSCRRG